MDPYTFCLILGGAGLLLMAVMGAGGARGHGAHAGHAAAGGHAAHGAPAPHAHAAPGAHSGHGTTAGPHGAAASPHVPASARLRSGMLGLLEPRAISSLLVGFGATGLLLRGTASGGVRLLLALAGALALESLVLGPVSRFLFRFASRPALTLESSITDRATAVTRFDAEGNGLVALELDGQIVQVLGTLRPDERAGPPIHAGDAVRIDDVDAARNRCTIRRLDD